MLIYLPTKTWRWNYSTFIRWYNTPGYIANLHKLYDKANKGNDADKQIFNSACNFIGLLQETKEEWLDYKKGKIDISETEIENKIELRNKARADKNYAEADNIRDTF